ncbi:MAG: translocation/assembly module TamB domain-containing protein [Desulfobacterales bacterium]|nr:translocation/assembly module TamB domain-containing protein [Desulfobacterales bacterium]
MKRKKTLPPKGRFRRLGVLLAGLTIAGFVAMVWAAGFILTSSDLPRRWIESRVNGMVAGRLSLGKVSVSLLRGRIDADRIVFRGDGGQEWISADRLLVDLAWWGLAGRTVVLETVEVEGLRIRASRDIEGRIDLVECLAPPRPDPPPPSEPDAPSWNVIVQSLTVIDGQVAIADAVSDVAVEIGGISVKLAADASALSAEADLGWTRATLAAGNRLVPLGSGRWQGRYRQGRLDPISLRVDGGPAPLVISGHVTDVLDDDPNLDLTLQARLGLADLSSILSAGVSLTGSATLDARLTGSVRAPKVALGLNCASGRLAGLPLDGFSVRAILTDQALDLQEAVLPYAGGRVSASGTIDLTRALPGGFFGNGFNGDALIFQGEFKADGPSIAALHNTFAGSNGRLNAQLRFSGKGIDPKRLSAQVDGRVRVDGFQAAPLVQPVDADARLAVRIDSEAVVVNDFQLRAGGTALTGTGRYDRQTERVISNLALLAPDLAVLSAAFGIKGGSGEAKADVQVQGPIDSLGVGLALNAASLELVGVTLGTLEAKADMDPSGRVTLDRAVLASGGSRVAARGTISLRDTDGRFHGTGPVRLKVDLENVVPADFYAAAPVSGRFGGRVELTGSIFNPTAEIRLSGEAVAVAAAVADTADLAARFEGGVLAVGHLRLKRNSSEVTASGSVGLVDPVTRQIRPDGPFDVRFSGNDLSLADFSDRFTGTLTLTAEGTGTLNHPTGRFRVSGKDLNLGVQRLDALMASGTLERSRVTVDTLTAVLGKGQQVTGQGWLDIDRRFSVDLSADPINLAAIDAVQSWGDPRGTLTVALSGRGLIDNPQVDGTVSVSDPVLFGHRLGDVHLTVSLADGEIRWDGASDFSMAGTYALASDDFRLSARFEETVLDPYFEMGGHPDFKGLVSATVDAEGNMAQWQRLRVDAAVSRLRIQADESGLIEAAHPFKVALNDGVLRIPEALFSLPDGGRMRLAGGGGMNGPMDLTVEGRIPLAAVAPLIPTLTEAQGDLSVTGHVGGTLEKPEIKGRIGLSKVGAAIAGLTQKVEAIEGEFAVTPAAVQILSLTGRVGEGRFEVRGTVAYQGVTPTTMDLRVSAQALPLTLPETLDLKADLALRISGPIQTAMVEGEVVLLEGLYYRDIKVSLVDQVTRRSRPATAPAAEMQAGGFGNIGLNVDVRHRQPFRIENNIASLDVVPDLKIGGTLAAPVINGRANVTSGSLFYQRKAFTVTKGVVDFLNPFKTEPTMDIAGEITVRHWRIVLTLTGPTDNLRFRMTSTPAEEESDILSLILFGKTARELAATEGGSAVPPAVLLARLVDSKVADSVKQSTGLDIFELDAAGTTGSSLAGTQVTIGKQLSRRLSLKYAVELADGQNVYKAISEYKLLEHVLVSGFQSSTGNFGGELLMRVEFR